MTSHFNPPPTGAHAAHRVHAALPDDMNKAAALRIIKKIAPALGLNFTDVRVLEEIADTTIREDWKSCMRTPINFRRQCDMARAVGITDRQFRNIEARLAQRGLIARNVADNGYRGYYSSSRGAETAAGLSLEPLIENIEHFLELAELMEREQEHAAFLRIEIRTARRRCREVIKPLLDDPMHEVVRIYVEAKQSWPQRIRDISSATDLSRHLKDLRDLSDRLSQLVDNPQNVKISSAASEKNLRSHIQPTTKSISVSCMPNRQIRTPCKQDEVESSSCATAQDGCIEKNDSGAITSIKPELCKKLTPSTLRGIASDETRFYIDNLRDPGKPRTLSDIETAVSYMLRDLGINPSAYEDAQETMGYFDAMVAVLIIDRNRSHPKNPVRKPGGALRAMTNRSKLGQLNLAGSLIGIMNRNEGSERVGV